MKLPDRQPLIAAIKAVEDIQNEIVSLNAEPAILKAAIEAHIKQGDIADEGKALKSVLHAQRLQMIPHAITRLENRIPAAHAALKQETENLGRAIAASGKIERDAMIKRVENQIRPFAGEETKRLALSFPAVFILHDWTQIPLPESPLTPIPADEDKPHAIRLSFQRAEAMLKFVTKYEGRSRIQEEEYPLK